jgi:hypothetical protein
MDESEKEINTGNRVFWAGKHCIFGKGEGKGPRKGQGVETAKGLLNYQLNESPIADIFNIPMKNKPANRWKDRAKRVTVAPTEGIPPLAGHCGPTSFSGGNNPEKIMA